MRIVYDPAFFTKLKKVNIRIRKSVKEKMLLFADDPYYPELDNHELGKEYSGCRSIDITADYRAIYQEARIGGDVVAYFILLGTHHELFGQLTN